MRRAEAALGCTASHPGPLPVCPGVVVIFGGVAVGLALLHAGLQVGTGGPSGDPLQRGLPNLLLAQRRSRQGGVHSQAWRRWRRQPGAAAAGSGLEWCGLE